MVGIEMYTVSSVLHGFSGTFTNDIINHFLELEQRIDISNKPCITTHHNDKHYLDVQLGSELGYNHGTPWLVGPFIR